MPSINLPSNLPSPCSWRARPSTGGSIHFGPNIGVVQLQNVAADSAGVQFPPSAEPLQIGGLVGYVPDATGIRIELACYRRDLGSIKWSGPGGVPIPEGGPRTLDLSTCGARIGLELGRLRGPN